MSVPEIEKNIKSLIADHTDWHNIGIRIDYCQMENQEKTCLECNKWNWPSEVKFNWCSNWNKSWNYNCNFNSYPQIVSI